MEKSSVYVDGEQEALRFKWIESEKAGCDLGEAAIRRWVQCHWWGYLRARWLEHLQGKKFWVELDRGDFGLLQRKFHDNTLLLDRILDRIKAGQENLDIICWAHSWGISPEPVLQILEALDINSRRLAHRSPILRPLTDCRHLFARHPCIRQVGRPDPPKNEPHAIGPPPTVDPEHLPGDVGRAAGETAQRAPARRRLRGRSPT